jgi:hypothetical protein
MLHIKVPSPCEGRRSRMRGDKKERPHTSILSPGGERIEVCI